MLRFSFSFSFQRFENLLFFDRSFLPFKGRIKKNLKKARKFASMQFNCYHINVVPIVLF